MFRATKEAIVRYLILVVLLAAALASSSCVVILFPIPDKETKIPSIEGIMRDDGKPLAEHTVIFRMGRVNDGWRYAAQTVTSANGGFLIPGKSNFRPVTILYTAPVDFGMSEYELVLRYADGNETVLYRNFLPKPPNTKKKIRFECDLVQCRAGCCKAIEE